MFGGQEAVESAARAQVEHNFPGLQFGHGLGVSAPQAQVGPLGNGGPVFGRIPQQGG